MIEKAYAKINLMLDVKHRRPDGYHEISSIMMPITLSDVVELVEANENQLICDDPSIPQDKTNLAWKALEFMQETYGINQAYQIHLHKSIPAFAGLGGGSSDAAAIIRCMAKLHGLESELSTIAHKASKLGADIPFCIYQKPMLVEGIGEKLTSLDLKKRDYQIILVKPACGISTKEAYEMLDLTTCEHPKSVDIIHAWQTNETLQLGNSLEQSAFQLEPVIGKIKEELIALGFEQALMSGSGSCVFGITEKREIVEKAYEMYKQKQYFTQICTFLYL